MGGVVLFEKLGVLTAGSILLGLTKAWYGNSNDIVTSIGSDPVYVYTHRGIYTEKFNGSSFSEIPYVRYAPGFTPYLTFFLDAKLNSSNTSIETVYFGVFGRASNYNTGPYYNAGMYFSGNAVYNATPTIYNMSSNEVLFSPFYQRGAAGSTWTSYHDVIAVSLR